MSKLTVSINDIELGENNMGLKQYKAIVQFDFFADSPTDAYRLIFDKLTAMYDETETARGLLYLKEILAILDKEGNIVKQGPRK